MFENASSARRRAVSPRCQLLLVLTIAALAAGVAPGAAEAAAARAAQAPQTLARGQRRR